ncbi:MAG: Skp family chaperone for outer membrane protein [Yoonia sp.]|jgi:Skp family chaperone for outer membrane proteins
MRRLLSVCCVLIGLASNAQAQNNTPLGVPVTGVVVVDTDELYRATRMGQRTAADLEERARALQSENDEITQALTAEERSLTDRRPTLAPEVFRAQAAEFDVRVQGIRRTRDAAIATFEADRDAAPRQFLELVRNVLGELMLERGAVAVLDQRIVFLSLSTVDITQDAIVRIDDTFGDGGGLPPQ